MLLLVWTHLTGRALRKVPVIALRMSSQPWPLAHLVT